MTSYIHQEQISQFFSPRVKISFYRFHFCYWFFSPKFKLLSGRLIIPEFFVTLGSNKGQRIKRFLVAELNCSQSWRYIVIINFLFKVEIGFNFERRRLWEARQQRWKWSGKYLIWYKNETLWHNFTFFLYVILRLTFKLEIVIIFIILNINKNILLRKHIFSILDRDRYWLLVCIKL